MKINLRYFGMVSEITEIGEETLDVDDSIEVNNLKTILITKYNLLDTISYKIAVNQSIKDDTTILNENDEVVLLPPFAGG